MVSEATVVDPMLLERAQTVIDAAKRCGFRMTISHLAGQAKSCFPALSEKERDLIATAALRLHAGEPMQGDGPIAKAADATSDGDWPVRSVPRRETTPEPEQRSMPAAPSGKLEPVLAALRRLLPKRLDASAQELYDELKSQGVDLMAFSSFVGHHVPAIRKELGISGQGARAAGKRRQMDATPRGRATPAPRAAAAKRQPPAPNGKDHVPRPAPMERELRITGPGADELILPSGATAGDEIRISGGDDSFTAVRKPDGTWAVSVVATVDEDTMGKLAAMTWQRVMGGSAA